VLKFTNSIPNKEDRGLAMFKKNLRFVKLACFFTIAALFLLSSPAICIDTIYLTKGNVYTFNNADFSHKNGERSFPEINSSGASEATMSSKSLRAYAKTNLSGKAKYNACVGNQMFFRFGSGNAYMGKIKVTMSGIGYMGKLGALGMGGGSGWVRMIVRLDDGSIYEETVISNVQTLAASVKTPSGTNITKSVVIPVVLKSGKIPTLFVELCLDTNVATGTVAKVIPGSANVDYYNEGRGASYNQIKIEILEGYAPGGKMKPI
jgi:hypothetical protein